MSDQEEKTCPLCAEEMDLTDQQLKPCKCGYEICVWCWHQIVEMAEKDETQGRCPACRIPYDKAKIVGMASRCERLVFEMNVEKKLKSQKVRSKPLEGRKQLDNVRVIQKNLVYVVGLPFHLAEEDILQRREYFAQYGKVLKVSISRTSTGAIQHFSNNTCNVYITYSNEEEAIRCIQLVHGFILDGRPLRACFGTTKYCHAWLRNVPCSNPDCLYLHEIGSLEDSFTKDEIISAYTRNQVQQITGAIYNSQRRSGVVLPSPTDDISDISSASQGKPTNKAIANSHPNLTGSRVSSSDSCFGGSAAPPIGASRGTRSSLTNTPVSGPPAQKPNVLDGLTSLCNAATSLGGKKVISDEKSSISQSTIMIESSELIVGSKADERASFDGTSVPISHFISSIQPTSLPTTIPLSNTSATVHSAVLISGPAEGMIDRRDGNIENVCSAILSMNFHADQNPQNGFVEHTGNSVIGGTSEKAVTTMESSGFRLGLPTEESLGDLIQRETDSLFLEKERVDSPAINVNRVHDFCQASSFHRQSTILSPQFNNFDGSINSNFIEQRMYRNRDGTVSTSYCPNRHPQKNINTRDCDDATCSDFSLVKGTRSLMKRCEGAAGSCPPHSGESSIISNMLPPDFSCLDEPFVLPRNLDELFGEEKQLHSKVIGSRNFKNSNQSRFAFAREEGSQVHDFARYGEEDSKLYPYFNNSSNSSILPVEKLVNHTNFPFVSGMESDIQNSHSRVNSSRISVSKSQISVPPGFPVPSRLPPPGFPSLVTEHKFESASGTNMTDVQFSQQNQCHVPMSDNTYINGDVEFIDPAILAVGKGAPVSSNNNSFGVDIRTGFPRQFGYEDPRVQPVMHRSLPPYENHGFPDIRDTIPRYGDGYGTSIFLEQKQSSSISPFSYFSFPQSLNAVPSTNTWDGWNDTRNVSNFDKPELLRTERLGFNDSYSSHEDSKNRIPSSNSLYNGIYRL